MRNIKKKIKKNIRKTIKKTKKFKRLNCSPLLNKHNQTKKLNNISCYNNKGLIKLRNYWNERHSDKKIVSNDPFEIWKEIQENLKNVCNTEMCWLRQKFIENNNRNLLDNFSPKAPESWKKNPGEWLSSIDISKVMHQYEKAYTNFNFIGPSPIDFDTKLLYDNCVWEELCKFNLENYIKKNVNKIGIVFNTDTHDKNGEHWISIFLDIKNKFIFYFDSNGNICPKEIKILVNRIQEQAKLLNIEFDYIDNSDLTHQKQDGQCGVYVLYFIIELLLENKTAEYFKTTRISDKEMKKYRSIYYNM